MDVDAILNQDWRESKDDAAAALCKVLAARPDPTQDLDILGRLFVGSMVIDADEVRRLQVNYRVASVLNLQTDEELRDYRVDPRALAAWYRARDIQLFRVPVEDNNEQDLRAKLTACVDGLDEIISSEKGTYVHCKLGNYRSPTVILGFLYGKLGWKLEDAVEYMDALRPSNRYRPAVEEAFSRLKS